MLLTDDWWGGSAENTSITSDRCHKTVKQNQCHIELAGFWCALPGASMHLQQAQLNPITPKLVKLWCDFQNSALKKRQRKEKSYKQIALQIHCVSRKLHVGSLFATSGQFIFSPVCKQPAATILWVFIRARDRWPWCSKTPSAVPASSSKKQEAIKTCT